MKEGTDGADLLQQLTGQKSGRQEPGDPEGAPVKHQVASVIAPSSTSAPPPLYPHIHAVNPFVAVMITAFFSYGHKSTIFYRRDLACASSIPSFGHCHIAAVYAIRICVTMQAYVHVHMQ